MLKKKQGIGVLTRDLFPPIIQKPLFLISPHKHSIRPGFI